MIPELATHESATRIRSRILAVGPWKWTKVSAESIDNPRPYLANRARSLYPFEPRMVKLLSCQNEPSQKLFLSPVQTAQAALDYLRIKGSSAQRLPRLDICLSLT
jgi:hypothetical protein